MKPLFELDDVAMWWAAPDYVRLTAGDPRNEDLADLYKQTAHRVVASSETSGLGWRPWTWMGYVGEACGSVAYGRSYVGHILQISGWQAADEAVLRLPFDNVPRWDVQLTVWLNEDVPSLGRRVVEASEAARDRAAHRPWRTTLIDGRGSGDTAYIGSRSSATFLRIYDKWREQGRSEEYVHAWRFELELKDSAAKPYWPSLHGPTPAPDYYAAIVLANLRSRGIHLPPIGALRDQIVPEPLRRRRPTDDSRLAWLRTQVAPSLDKLRASGVDLGVILEALGLQDAVK